MATQNPIEQEGTYPLPEAQLDRFFFKLVVGYSQPRGAGDDRRADDQGRDRSQPEKVMDGAEIVQWQQLVREVILAPHVQDYIVRLMLATHPDGPFACRSRTSICAGAAARAGANAGAGGQGAGAVGRAVQRQLRGRAARVSAGAAAPRDLELRGPGRRDRSGPGAAGNSGEGAGEGGRRERGEGWKGVSGRADNRLLAIVERESLLNISTCRS